MNDDIRPATGALARELMSFLDQHTGQELFPLLESLRGHVASDEKLERIAACWNNAIANIRA